jgi:hypothetical protein
MPKEKKVLKSRISKANNIYNVYKQENTSSITPQTTVDATKPSTTSTTTTATTATTATRSPSNSAASGGTVLNSNKKDDVKKDDVKKDDVKKDDESGLSRGQRKRLARRQAHDSRAMLINQSLTLNHFRDEKKKKEKEVADSMEIDGGGGAVGGGAVSGMMANVKNALPAYNPGLQKPAVAPPSIVTNSAKKSTTASELTHLSLVVSHPSFQQNPFLAIQQHLNNTLPNREDNVGDARHGKKVIVDPFADVVVKKRNGSAKRRSGKRS